MLSSHLVRAVVLSGFIIGASKTRAEGDADLRAEFMAMRQAYESRIAALEDKVKELSTTGVQQQQTAERKVDQALTQKGAVTLATAPSYQIPAGINAVKGSTQINLGGYTEFTYIDRTTRTPQFNQLKTVGEISAKIDDRIHLYLEVEQENGAI